MTIEQPPAKRHRPTRRRLWAVPDVGGLEARSSDFEASTRQRLSTRRVSAGVRTILDSPLGGLLNPHNPYLDTFSTACYAFAIPLTFPRETDPAHRHYLIAKGFGRERAVGEFAGACDELLELSEGALDLVWARNGARNGVRGSSAIDAYRGALGIALDNLDDVMSGVTSWKESVSGRDLPYISERHLQVRSKGLQDGKWEVLEEVRAIVVGCRQRIRRSDADSPSLLCDELEVPFRRLVDFSNKTLKLHAQGLQSIESRRKLLAEAAGIDVMYDAHAYALHIVDVAFREVLNEYPNRAVRDAFQIFSRRHSEAKATILEVILYRERYGIDSETLLGSISDGDFRAAGSSELRMRRDLHRLTDRLTEIGCPIEIVRDANVEPRASYSVEL